MANTVVTLNVTKNADGTITVTSPSAPAWTITGNNFAEIADAVENIIDMVIKA